MFFNSKKQSVSNDNIVRKFQKIKELIKKIKPPIINFYNKIKPVYPIMLIFPMILILIILIYFIVLCILGFFNINIVLPKGVLYWLATFFIFVTYTTLFLAIVVIFSHRDNDKIGQDNILPNIIANFIRSTHLMYYSLGLMVGSSILYGLYKLMCGGKNYNLNWTINLYDNISVVVIIACIVFSIVKIFKPELSGFNFPFLFLVLAIVYLSFKSLIFYFIDFISNVINYLTTVWVFKGNIPEDCYGENCESDKDKESAAYLLITPFVLIFCIAIVILQVCPPFWIFTGVYKANTAIGDKLELAGNKLADSITSHKNNPNSDKI